MTVTALAVVCALLAGLGCASPSGNEVECAKAEWFDPDGAMQLYYILDYNVAFAPDKDGNPTQGVMVEQRLDYLEGICKKLPPFVGFWDRVKAQFGKSK